ncbi:MAG: hypothetical protein ABI172_00355 [Ginsengibacter sp.]|jgi:predicted RNA-binding Zn-ribbon protein involved in translation (DUF1610 family)
MDLITVRTFQNYFSAQILLTKLRSAGVECYLKDEFTVTMAPFLSNGLGGIKLVVKKKDEREVLLLLEQFDDEYRKSAVCPKCGSNNIELVPKRSTGNLLTAILSWLFSNYAISSKNVYQCGTCGFESDTLPESFHNTLIEHEEELN